MLHYPAAYVAATFPTSALTRTPTPNTFIVRLQSASSSDGNHAGHRPVFRGNKLVIAADL